jgi:acyl carrier protein
MLPTEEHHTSATAAKHVRTLIAHQLGVDIKRVTDEAHFADDLGADWLDRLELMIEIEAQFPAVEFTEDDVDQIDVVGDLIRHLRAQNSGQESSVVERSNLEDALWKALQELAESNFLHRLRFWRGWGRELPGEIDRRLRPLEEAVSARSSPTETDCVAGHVRWGIGAGRCG